MTTNDNKEPKVIDSKDWEEFLSTKGSSRNSKKRQLLDTYKELIRQSIENKKSYKDIADFITEKSGIKISMATIRLYAIEDLGIKPKKRKTVK